MKYIEHFKTHRTFRKTWNMWKCVEHFEINGTLRYAEYFEIHGIF